jgi:RecA/RadA recombinase
MKKYNIEGSRDSEVWMIYSKAETLEQAKEIAAKCIRITNYTAVRIVEDLRVQAVFA